MVQAAHCASVRSQHKCLEKCALIPKSLHRSPSHVMKVGFLLLIDHAVLKAPFLTTKPESSLVGTHILSNYKIREESGVNSCVFVVRID